MLFYLEWIVSQSGQIAQIHPTFTIAATMRILMKSFVSKLIASVKLEPRIEMMTADTPGN